MFYRLGDLRKGALVEITRADRSVAVFAVNSVERFDKNRLPADRAHEGDGGPGLRLITCGGAGIGGSIGYADNTIAFAWLVGSRQR